jgi:2-oxoglutarate dehydrogenase E2 component (dihydrolipoamide succinyltransferase)
MSVELKVPSVGESITEVQIGDWLKSEGQRIEQDETLVMIETDKVTVELPAPVSGVLSQIKVKTGETASVGDVIGTLEEGAAQPKQGDGKRAESKQPKAERPEPKAKAKAKAEPEEEHEEEVEEEEEPLPEPSPESLPAHGFARVMPAARRALAEKGLSADQVEPSGPGGRLLKEDVQRHEQRSEATELPEEVVQMTPMRRRIAERLVQAQQSAALLTTFNEIDMSEVMALRKQHQASFQDKYGIKLGFMSFFVKATIEGLKLIPQVNAEIRGDAIVYKNHYDIGVAVGSGKGLVVPVIRGADRLSFAEIEQAIADLGGRAQKGKLKLEELQGGTFTISNGGIYGNLLSTPIVNPPQSGILGMHAIQERAVVRDGQIVARPMMYVAVTYDHRIIDGREAVTFLKRIKQCVESPTRILLEV